MAEMQSLSGTVKNAQEPFPHLYQRHKVVKKSLAKLWKTLATDTQETARKDHFQNAPVLEVDRQIKQLLSKSDVEGCDADHSADENWELPTLNYVFPEQAHLVENFYSPNTETFDEDKLLAQHIQVTKDMVVLLQLCELPQQGNQVNWNFNDRDDELLEQPEEPMSFEEDTLVCPTDVCIICCGVSHCSASNPPPHKFSSKQKDSLHHHLIQSHLVHAHDRISCNWEACSNMPKFSKVTEFLAHAAQVHTYDIKIKLCHLPQSPRIACSAISSIDSSEVSSECDSQPQTETPASVDFEITNIDQRLLEPQTVNKELPSNQPRTLMSSVGSGVTNIGPCSTEIATRQKTMERAAKVASSEPEPQRQHVTRSSLHHDHSEAQPGVLKSSIVKPLLRRSKRLKS